MAGSEIPVKLSVPQTEQEEVPPTTILSKTMQILLTSQTQRNIAVVKEYMAIAYSPKNNKGRSSVEHLCLPNSTFTAPATFPTCHTPLDYADSHAHIMSSIADLHIASYDYVFAKDSMVLLRYSAEGSHCGDAHNGIPAGGKRANWSAAAIFEVQEGKIRGWTKEWDKLNMWKQLGWMKGDEYV